ncbi:hypothetical protein [Vibrio ostreicida]|uniref:hypothetical protein n=1 Tax=Vibrio ostreicida TaxID=526588 RepID=UPI0009704AB5|nr:hypothetical protein [Vibrio ostreicida]
MIQSSLSLESDGGLLATLEVDSLTLSQGDERWIIDNPSLDLRTLNHIHWQVAFSWQFAVYVQRPIDVTLILRRDSREIRWVDKNVGTNLIY